MVIARRASIEFSGEPEQPLSGQEGKRVARHRRKLERRHQRRLLTPADVPAGSLLGPQTELDIAAGRYDLLTPRPDLRPPKYSKKPKSVKRRLARRRRRLRAAKIDAGSAPVARR